MVVETHTMWLKCVLLLTISTVLCNGNKDTSCDFTVSPGWCSWRITDAHCTWDWSRNFYHGNKGYVYLDGCSSSFRRKFAWYEGYAINHLTIEYYVEGPGPFSLYVTDDKNTKPDWSCSIQPGNDIRRTAHVSVKGSAKYIFIKGRVNSGSRIIITQIWNSLQGHSAQSKCPPLPTTPKPTTRPTTAQKTTPTTTESTSTTPTTRPKTMELTTTSMDQTTVTVSPSTLINKRTSLISKDPQFRSTLNKGLSSTTPMISLNNTSSVVDHVVSTHSSTGITNALTNRATTTVKSEATETPELNPTVSTVDNQTKPSTGGDKSEKIPDTPATSPSIAKVTTGINHESTSHTVQMGVASAQIQKEKSKNKIIGGVAGVSAVGILIVIVINIIIKRRKRTAYQMSGQPKKSGNDVTFENPAFTL